MWDSVASEGAVVDRQRNSTHEEQSRGATTVVAGAFRVSQAICLAARPARTRSVGGMDAALEAARWITAVVFIGIGVTHFVPSVVRGMAAMVPAVFRGRPFSPQWWVYVTGIAEIAGGLGLLVEPTRAAAGIALAVFLVCVFPANAFAAHHRDRFGVFAVPFWPRLLLLVLLIALVLWVGLA